MLARCISTGLTPTMEPTLTIGKIYTVHDVTDDPGGIVYVVTDDTGEKLPVPNCLFHPVLSDPATVAGFAVNLINRLRDSEDYERALADEGLDDKDIDMVINTLSAMAWQGDHYDTFYVHGPQGDVTLDATTADEAIDDYCQYWQNRGDIIPRDQVSADRA